MEIKNVQIPFTLFRQLVSYHLLDDYSCSDEICKGLKEKMDHLVNRQLYTQSKTAATEEEREKPERSIWIRKEYRRTFVGRDSSCLSYNRSVARTCKSRTKRRIR